MIKLLTPAMREYRLEYNDWLESIPQHIKELVFVAKRYYKPEWGKDWRSHFSVDIINGTPGNELKCDNRKLVTTYCAWVSKTVCGEHSLRKDFHPAARSRRRMTSPRRSCCPGRAALARSSGRSVKLVKNCERRFFSGRTTRSIAGLRQANRIGLFAAGQFSVELPTAHAEGRARHCRGRAELRSLHAADAAVHSRSRGHRRTDLLCIDGASAAGRRNANEEPALFAAAARTSCANAMFTWRKWPHASRAGCHSTQPVLNPVTAVLPGRRNNPPDVSSGIRPLAVYNPSTTWNCRNSSWSSFAA